jgi:hypothetical protein
MNKTALEHAVGWRLEKLSVYALPDQNPYGPYSGLDGAAKFARRPTGNISGGVTPQSDTLPPVKANLMKAAPTYGYTNTSYGLGGKINGTAPTYKGSATPGATQPSFVNQQDLDLYKKNNPTRFPVR